MLTFRISVKAQVVVFFLSMKVRELFVAVFFAFRIFGGIFQSKLLSEDEGSRVVHCRIFCFRDFLGLFPQVFSVAPESELRSE